MDTYIDSSTPYPDAKVAAVLCVGGAVKYVVREGSQVSSEFILTHISTNVAKIFPREAALVLGIAYFGLTIMITLANYFLSHMLTKSRQKWLKYKVH